MKRIADGVACCPARVGSRLPRGLALAAVLWLAAAPSHGAQRSTTLDGPWLFQPDPDAVGEARGWDKPEADRSGWRRVTVPTAWDHYDPTMSAEEGARRDAGALAGRDPVSR